MKKICIIYLFLTVVFFPSCSTSSDLSKTEEYFQALEKISAENNTVGKKDMTKLSYDENKTISFFATETVLPFLLEEENYLEILKITESRLKVIEESKEDLVGYTTNINLLKRYKLIAMLKLEDEKSAKEIEEWVLETAFTSDKNIFFESEEYNLFLEKNPTELSSKTLTEISVQKDVYTRNYGRAAASLIDFVDFDGDYYKETFKTFNPVFLSSVGRALLYGTSNPLKYAELLEEISVVFPEKSEESFLVHFYSARLFGRSGKAYNNNALNEYKKAMENSSDESEYDNALWYYLSLINSSSARTTISALQEFAPNWHDAYYFDDLLESLAYQLLDDENYIGFYGVFEYLNEYMSPVSLSKYAYLSARLIEENLVAPELDENTDKKSTIKNLFTQSFEADGGTLYYRLLAATELGISTEKVLKETLLAVTDEEIKTVDEFFEHLLIESTIRGYEQGIYSKYIQNSSFVSVEGAVALSKAFSMVNDPQVENNYAENYYPESLRIASRAFSEKENDITKEDMELLYPRYYTEYVSQVSEVYDLEEYIIYAIIRSESFFDHDVFSSAGAVGLTQLIPSTAADVARKLRIEDYDLKSPRENIDIGMYYFDELIPREGVDYSILRALFSYNAGITNVRRWVRAYPELLDDPDLFLEKIPFAETREYGRKILTAAAMYGMLYYDMEVSEVVEIIMN